MSEGRLAAAYRECCQLLDQQKVAGLSFDDRMKGVEATIRAVWPFTREWHALCETCGDYGLRMFECLGDRRCGRGKPHLPHDYGDACTCKAGLRFRKTEAAAFDAVAAAAKVPKPKALSRFGR